MWRSTISLWFACKIDKIQPIAISYIETFKQLNKILKKIK